VYLQYLLNAKLFNAQVGVPSPEWAASNFDVFVGLDVYGLAVICSVERSWGV